MVARWPDEDDAYLVSPLEWEGRVHNPVTHGDSHEDAIEQAHESVPGPRVLFSSAR